VLVNTSRGTLVDSDALAQALREKWIWGAGHPLVKEPRSVYGSSPPSFELVGTEETRYCSDGAQMRNRTSHRKRNARDPTGHGEPGGEKCADRYRRGGHASRAGCCRPYRGAALEAQDRVAFGMGADISILFDFRTGRDGIYPWSRTSSISDHPLRTLFHWILDSLK